MTCPDCKAPRVEEKNGLALYLCGSWGSGPLKARGRACGYIAELQGIVDGLQAQTHETLHGMVEEQVRALMGK